VTRLGCEIDTTGRLALWSCAKIELAGTWGKPSIFRKERDQIMKHMFVILLLAGKAGHFTALKQ
jgi:hypothetical protein